MTDPATAELIIIKKLLICALQKNGVSQGEIATALGTNQSTVSRMLGKGQSKKGRRSGKKGNGAETSEVADA